MPFGKGQHLPTIQAFFGRSHRTWLLSADVSSLSQEHLGHPIHITPALGLVAFYRDPSPEDMICYKDVSIHLLFTHRHTKKCGGEAAMVPRKQAACQGLQRRLLSVSLPTEPLVPWGSKWLLLGVLETLQKLYNGPRKHRAYMGQRQCSAPVKPTAQHFLWY